MRIAGLRGHEILSLRSPIIKSAEEPKSEPLSIGKAEPLEDLGQIRKTRRVPS